MSEWSGLFKSAIASLDSRLDQAMGDATTDVEDPTAVDPTPITTTADFDLPEAQLAFLDFYRARFEPMASKIKHLAEENVLLLDKQPPSKAAANAKKIDLLLDEGRRLSVQELKLNTTIKKLRGQLAALQSAREDSTTATSQLEVAEKRHAAAIDALRMDAQALRTKSTELERQLVEAQARSEHYRLEAEARPGPSSVVRDVDARTLESHEQARESWQATESALLGTIADLESAAERREQHLQGLKQRVDAAQAQSHELRELLEQGDSELKRQLDELRATKDAELSALRNQLEAKDEEIRELGQALEGVNERKVSPDASGSPGASPGASPGTSSASPRSPPQLHIHTPRMPSPRSDRATPTPRLSSAPSSPLPHPPPLVPFEETTPPALDSFPASPIDRDDSFASLGSAGAGVGAGDTHILAKLSQANRKLEAQLLMARESLASARREKDAAYSEMLQHMAQGAASQAAQTELAGLREQHALLLRKLGQKSEQVEELRADVSDLKEMYQTQVQALVGEIEKLKRR